MRVRRGFWWSLLLLLYLPACTSFNDLTGPKAVPNVVASVEVPLPQATLGVGGTIALQALIRDGNGKLVSDHAVMWTTNDALIARVSPEGLVTAVGVGIAKIAASAEGRSAIATLTITPRAVASVRVNVPNADIFIGSQLQLTSTTLGEGGDVLTGRTVFWSSSDPKIASIDNTGLLSGLSVGIATITATSEQRSASVGVTVSLVPVRTIQVTPTVDSVVIGQTTQLNASARDSIGTSLTDRVISWSSSDNSIATVSSSGLVVGAKIGTVTITASAEGKSGTSRIAVRARPVGTVFVSPAQSSITVGQSFKLQVLITGDDGTLLTGRPIEYTSGNGGIAQVSADGTVTGVSQGTTVITVSSEGRSGTASITVGASPIATVRINPETGNLLIGTSQKLTPVLLDASNNVLPQRPVVWLSGAPTIATVAIDGTVNAIGVGTAIIFATIEGKIAQATINVREIAVSSVTLSPAATTMIVGDALDLVDQVRESGGALLANRIVTWSSSDDHIAVVSSSGRVRALAAGQALITATSDGKSGSSAITVTIESVLSITAEPSSLSLLPGGSATIIATPRGRNGIPLSGRQVSFSSSDATTATVSAAGLVTGVKTGTASIVVASEGKQVIVLVTVSPAPVATVSVTLAEPARFVGQSTQATAVMRDGSNNILSGRAVAWTTSNSLVATVSTTGVVSAIAPGTATIVATSEGKTGSAAVTVAVVPVATVNVSLVNSTRFVNQTTQASAVTLDGGGNVLIGRPVTWSSSNTAVATVSQTGVVTAVAPGNANIIATSETKTGQAQITVSLVPVATVSVSIAAPARFVAQTTTATAVLRDANNNILTGRTINWTSSNTDVATVSPSGVVTALAPGSANITATSEGKIGFANVTVTLAPVASVTVSLGSSTPLVGHTTQASAVLRDALGNTLAGRVITWSTSSVALATVTQSGLVTGVLASATPVNIIATSEGVSGSAPATVTLAPVATTTVNVSSLGMLSGQFQQATVVLKDDIGLTLTGRTVVWASSNAIAATVSSAGVINSLNPGTTTISATSEGKSGSVLITVAQAPVASVAVTLQLSGLQMGQTTIASAVTRDVANNILPGRSISWSSSDPVVATVSAGGIVTAKSPGTASIIATSEGISGSAQIVISLIPVSSVVVSLSQSTVFVGDPSQATAVALDAQDNVLPGRIVNYSSSNPAVATVSPTGAITTLSAGATTIFATSEGKSGSVPLTVNNRPVSNVSVTLGSQALTVLQTTQAAATLKAANNSILTGRSITWTSSNQLVAIVSASGVVTALLPGTAEITATSEGVSGSATVNVSLVPVASVFVSLNPTGVSVGQTSQGSATTRDAFGAILTGRSIVWASTNSAVATVDPSTGLVTSKSAGTTNITATTEGKSNFALLTVAPVSVATVALTLSPSTIQVGQTSQGTVITSDAGGAPLIGRVVSWSSSAPSTASVNTLGLVTALAPGTADITATSEGRTDTKMITVGQIPVASVSVTLTPAGITLAQTSQATAVTKDANNNVLVGRAVSWGSSNQAVAIINAFNGAITPITVGTTTITGLSEGKTDSQILTVSAVPVATVAVTLTPASILTNQTSQANAVLRDAANNTLSGRSIAWSSSNVNVATVDPTSGLVTALSVAGTTTITAISEGKTNSATLTVALAPVVTIAVSLGASTIATTQTTIASAVLRDANNNVLAGRAIVWSSSNQNAATVNAATGLVTPVAPGSSNIIATSEGKTSFAVVTITAVPVATVAVTLTPSTINAVQTSQATAVLKDAASNTLSGRTVVWSSSNVNVATIDPGTGFITGIAAGTTTITATSETKTDAKDLTVTLAPVATVVVTLNPTTTVPSQTSQATALLKDSQGRVLTGRTVSWISSNTSVATVNSATGVVTAVTAGTADITATSETRTGLATFTVATAPVATVTLTLTPNTISTIQTSQGSVVLKDAANNTLTGRTVTWLSSNTNVATVDGSGLITPLLAGTTTITATSETKTDNKVLTVTLAPV
ncbi:MAG: Ig-like domain-containing protein, partial [Gemmatimonadaceae bacterium]